MTNDNVQDSGNAKASSERKSRYELSNTDWLFSAFGGLMGAATLGNYVYQSASKKRYDEQLDEQLRYQQEKHKKIAQLSRPKPFPFPYRSIVSASAYGAFLGFLFTAGGVCLAKVGRETVVRFLPTSNQDPDIVQHSRPLQKGTPKL